MSRKLPKGAELLPRNRGHPEKQLCYQGACVEAQNAYRGIDRRERIARSPLHDGVTETRRLIFFVKAVAPRTLRPLRREALGSV